MRIERFGGTDPEVAIVGGIHGDEPCGARAVEHVLDDPPAFERPVAVVLANEEALAAESRFVDEDLNRAFPGALAAETHEGRLAARLTSAIGDCLTLALHSTQSHDAPFAIVDGVHGFAREVAPQLTLDALVDAGDFDGGRIFAGVPETIEVECGYQGSPLAVENAVRVTGEFLAAVDALDAETDAAQFPGADPTASRPPLPVYRLADRVPKAAADRYEVYVENFEQVAAGEAFASVDGEAVRASDAFYPVLLSAEGYADQFGYAATFVETLE